MRLLQASIRGFGRLVDRHLEFARHVQIIVGPNEAGKSTLQQFLLAALFGLKREGRKRRDYLPQYERYRPWEAASYEGSLRYELSNGEQWEVQRVFDRDASTLRSADQKVRRALGQGEPLATTVQEIVEGLLPAS